MSELDDIRSLLLETVQIANRLSFSNGQKMVVKAEKPASKWFQQGIDLEACWLKLSRFKP